MSTVVNKGHFVLLEQKRENWAPQEISRNSASQIFPYNYHCRGLCDRNNIDRSCNLSHDAKVGGFCVFLM